VRGMLAYYSCDEIRPPVLLYFLLEEIRDRRSFSQAGNWVHGVQNEPFRVCSPSEETLRFQGPAHQDLSQNSSVPCGEERSNLVNGQGL
jgi:hypothetical protein